MTTPATKSKTKNDDANAERDGRRAKIGEIVFFNTDYHAQSFRKRPTVLPAIVVFVNGDGAVNLAVFTDEGHGTEVVRGIHESKAKDLQEKSDPNSFSFQNEEPVKTTKEQDEAGRKLPTATLDSDTRESQQAYEDRKDAELKQSEKAQAKRDEERKTASASEDKPAKPSKKAAKQAAKKAQHKEKAAAKAAKKSAGK